MVTTCEMITSAQKQHLHSEQEMEISIDFQEVIKSMKVFRQEESDV